MLQALQSADPRVIGPYRLLRQLGGGGMGQVFLGLSAGGRLVAVKVIRPELAADPEFRERFGREVAAARKVSGVFTAAVVDADVDGPVPWLATAYVAGPSLAQAVSEHGPLPAASVLALAAGLAESLAAIHAAGVVHRDLKPSNVLLAEDGPRVIDFGISRAGEVSSMTQTGFVMGSPGFMSPEQAEGRPVGPPSDIFSLGTVLAFAATGEGPFGGGSSAALVYRIVHGTPDLDKVPAQVRPLIERCLAKDPGERPATGDLLAGIGVGQPDEGWLPTSLNAVRPARRRLGWGAAAAAVIAAAAATAVTLSSAVNPSLRAATPAAARPAARRPRTGPARTPRGNPVRRPRDVMARRSRRRPGPRSREPPGPPGPRPHRERAARPPATPRPSWPIIRLPTGSSPTRPGRPGTPTPRGAATRCPRG